MKRLVDEPDAGTAGQLIRAARGFELDPLRKSRVRARLAGAGERQPARRLRPALVLAVLIALGAVAGATVVRRVLSDASPPAARAPEPPAAPPRSRPHAGKLRGPVAPPPPIASPDPSVTPDPPRRPPSPSRTAAVPPAIAPPATPPSTPPAPDPAEAALVIEATRALRVERDPRRALGLLDRYLREYPRGVIVEEALALAIESASVDGDRSAAAYARRYLERFPAGRWGEAARRAIHRGR